MLTKPNVKDHPRAVDRIFFLFYSFSPLFVFFRNIIFASAKTLKRLNHTCRFFLLLFIGVISALSHNIIACAFSFMNNSFSFTSQYKMFLFIYKNKMSTSIERLNRHRIYHRILFLY